MKQLVAVSISANLSVPYTALNPLNMSIDADILSWAVEVVGRYNDCANLYSIVIKTVQQGA